MAACQDPEVLLRSPNVEAAIAASAAAALLLETFQQLPDDTFASLASALEDFIDTGAGGLL